MSEVEFVEIPEFKWKTYLKELKDADDLNNKDEEAPKTEPFIYRYEARKIYEKYELIFADMYEKFLKEGDSNKKEEEVEGEEEANKDSPSEDISPQDEEENGELKEEGEEKKIDLEMCRCECGRILTLLGINQYITEDVAGAQLEFEKALKLLSVPCVASNISIPNRPKLTIKIYSPKCIVSLTSVLNHLGLIWYNRKESEKALWNLQMAEYFYTNHTGDKSIALEQNFTLTCYYLAQAYAIQKKRRISARYSFLTLRRQWYQKDPFSRTEWAINAAMLSSYFIENNLFALADHCLKCAMAAIRKDKVSGDSEPERIREIEANVSILYSNFYKEKLQVSKTILADKKIKEEEKQKTTGETKKAKEPDNLADALFSEMFQEQDEELDEDNTKKKKKKKKEEEEEEEEDDEDDGEIELGELRGFDGNNTLVDEIPLKKQYAILNLEDAIFNFKLGKKFCDTALKYFVIDGYVTDHIRILQTLCEMYSSLSTFEPSRKRRIAIHKRRIALFLEVANDLNAKYYLDTKKQLLYTIGETYSTIVEEYFEDLDTADNKSELCQLLNEMGLKAIEYLKKFQDLFNDPETKKFTVEKMNRHAVVSSMFTLASVYYKIEPVSILLKRKFLVLALKEFRRLNEFIKAEKFSEEEKQEVKLESELSEEMEYLIPFKIREIDEKSKKTSQKFIDFE